jgi:outer membrane lipoprotein-sorting protein
MTRLFVTVPLMLLCAVASWAEPANAGKQLNANSSAGDVLEALHARGRDLRDFAADVTLTETDVLGKETERRGTVWYQRRQNGDTRIRVGFTEKKLSGSTFKQRLEYLLDNGKLVEQNFETKLQITRQVLKPGQKLDPLKLGEGPFPLPIGQPPEEVLKNFEVQKQATTKDDPAGSVHVQLAPKAGTRFAKKFKTIDVFVSPENNFPVRIDALENGDTDRVTNLSNIRINAGLKDAEFELPAPQKDWGVRDEELSD